MTFVVRNEGRFEHQLILVREDAPEVAALAAGQPGRADALGGTGRFQPLRPGASSQVAFDLRPGRYLVARTEPGQYLAGLRASLEVRWP